MSKIASTYAKALYDIALEENVLEEVKNDFNVIVSSIKEQPQFLNVLTLPKLDKEEKKQLIKSIFSSNTPQISVNFLMVLIDKDRIDLLNEIVVAFNQMVNEHFGIVEGTVYSAVPLSDAQLNQLTYVFTKKLNQKVKLNVVIDPSLLGGYKVNLGDVVYDNTIKLQLKNLKQNLMNVELK
ncbi:MAG: F0F1 ATP synthase subunit delta [Turicibacter sanguinis]|jgi:ATP synthase F1, delta subunit|uniref:F0F1 ATP synthase subunit delta n=1 Tax=Turicibacter TaxID=191303 RepID=UPI0001FDAF70|nr:MULTISPECIES: F0F1 ATP synthase subunit delta [Turicibacter]EGC93429.1 ATP synthase F1, delta subunit [Turicibacter sp. HGF1]MBP3905157.1 F0F1 ATP synthase subunit delta [Turicibacter sp.]MCU7195428.1 F0F1 ATP synthase subunit delta [Turicibacter sanguinis]MCU7201612.1 F0F1 ATP synthase subunit delta [Turicibacter sanguinis]MCU7212274.1 F0F1 ATP synthase subunit delta [Turicibacter sanguinis]